MVEKTSINGSLPEDCCGKCLHFVKHPTELNMGLCKALPPHPVAIMTQHGPSMMMVHPGVGVEQEPCGTLYDPDTYDDDAANDEGDGDGQPPPKSGMRRIIS